MGRLFGVVRLSNTRDIDFPRGGQREIQRSAQLLFIQTTRKMAKKWQM